MRVRKFRRYNTTLAGGVNRRFGREPNDQAQRADTPRFCVGPPGLGTYAIRDRRFTPPARDVTSLRA